MTDLFTLDLEKIIKLHFGEIIEEHQLQFTNKSSPTLENEFCELHFVRFDQITLKFHFAEKGQDFEYKVDTYADILDRKGFYSRLKIKFDEKDGLSQKIDTMVASLAEQTKIYLSKPLRGIFDWKEDYYKREKELKPLLDFIFKEKNGRTARRLFLNNDSNWEEVAKIDMLR
ncbi:hypothetical protein [Dokdonia sp. R78006]|uniref:hypothetical protein n=1 Tax=Dokdonia sp. R78006 TaxID=3093866 RepID=UPI0036D3448F